MIARRSRRCAPSRRRSSVAIAAPQTQPPSFVVSTRTVAVYATVTNARGRLVPDLVAGTISPSTTTASGRR